MTKTIVSTEQIAEMTKEQQFQQMMKEAQKISRGQFQPELDNLAKETKEGIMNKVLIELDLANEGYRTITKRRKEIVSEFISRWESFIEKELSVWIEPEEEADLEKEEQLAKEQAEETEAEAKVSGYIETAEMMRITIERLEGPTALCNQPKKYYSWRDANDEIRRNKLIAPTEGYDKFSFKVEFDNDMSYQGRLDLTKHGEQTIQKRIRDHVNAMMKMGNPEEYLRACSFIDSVNLPENYKY